MTPLAYLDVLANLPHLDPLEGRVDAFDGHLVISEGRDDGIVGRDVREHEDVPTELLVLGVERHTANLPPVFLFLKIMLNEGSYMFSSPLP